MYTTHIHYIHLCVAAVQEYKTKYCCLGINASLIILYSSKSFAPFTLYSLYFKICESVTLQNVKKNVGNTEIVYRYDETNSQISEFAPQLFWKFPKFKFSQKFCKISGTFIMFIEKAL